MKVSVKRTALQNPNPVEHEAKLARPDSPSDGVVVHVPGAHSAAPSASFYNPVDIPASTIVAAPSSPSSNRERFLKGLLPSRTCCNLDLIRSPAGTKFNLTAVCIAVFPATQNPDRRYIQLADITGSVGVTVWNHNVEKFSSSSVGRLVTLAKAVIGNNNGKKQLTMARDSSVDFCDDPKHLVASWWQELLLHPAKSCGSVHDMDDNSIASVSGILGFVSTETKIVNGREKNLLTFTWWMPVANWIFVLGIIQQMRSLSTLNDLSSFVECVWRPSLARNCASCSTAQAPLWRRRSKVNPRWKNFGLLDLASYPL